MYKSFKIGQLEPDEGRDPMGFDDSDDTFSNTDEISINNNYCGNAHGEYMNCQTDD